MTTKHEKETTQATRLATTALKLFLLSEYIEIGLDVLQARYGHFATTCSMRTDIKQGGR